MKHTCRQIGTKGNENLNWVIWYRKDLENVSAFYDYPMSNKVACMRTSSVAFFSLEKFFAFSIAIDA